MSWGKVSDSFYDDPDTEALSLEAIGVLVLMWSWCAKHETDGRISEQKALGLARGRKKLVDELLVTNEDGEAMLVRNGSGLLVRNYTKYNPTKQQLEKQREKWRSSKGGSKGEAA